MVGNRKKGGELPPRRRSSRSSIVRRTAWRSCLQRCRGGRGLAAFKRAVCAARHLRDIKLNSHLICFNSRKCQPSLSRRSLTLTTAPSSWSPRLPSSATSCCRTTPPTSAHTFLNIIVESLLKSKLRLPRTAGLPPSPQINPQALQQLLLQQTLLLLSLSLFLPYPLHPPRQ